MTQKTSPFISAKYGWDLGESGWNIGMDENLLKFSFLFQAEVEALVSSLPASNFQDKAYYLLTEGSFYYHIDGGWYFSPCPEHFTFHVKSENLLYQKINGSVVVVDSQSQLSQDVQSLLSSQANFVSNSEFSAFVDNISSDILGEGSALVGRSIISIDSVQELLTLPLSAKRTDLIYSVKSYHAGYESRVEGPTGGGLFIWDSTKETINDGGLVISGFVRIYSSTPDASWFGALRGQDITDALRKAYSVSQDVTIGEGTWKITGEVTNTDQLKNASRWGLIGKGSEQTLLEIDVPLDTVIFTSNSTNSKTVMSGVSIKGISSASRNAIFLQSNAMFARAVFKDIEFQDIKACFEFNSDFYSTKFELVKTVGVEYGIDIPSTVVSTQNIQMHACRWRAVKYGIRNLAPAMNWSLYDCIYDTKDSTNSDGINSIYFAWASLVNIVGGYNESRNCGTFEFFFPVDRGYQGQVRISSLYNVNNFTSSRNSTGIRFRGRINATLDNNYHNGWNTAVSWEADGGALSVNDSFANINTRVSDTATNSSRFNEYRLGQYQLSIAPTVGGQELMRTGDSQTNRKVQKFWNGEAREVGRYDFTAAAISTSSETAPGWFRSATLTIPLIAGFSSVVSGVVEFQRGGGSLLMPVVTQLNSVTTTSLTFFLVSPVSVSSANFSVSYVVEGSSS